MKPLGRSIDETHMCNVAFQHFTTTHFPESRRRSNFWLFHMKGRLTNDFLTNKSLKILEFWSLFWVADALTYSKNYRLKYFTWENSIENILLSWSHFAGEKKTQKGSTLRVFKKCLCMICNKISIRVL